MSQGQSSSAVTQQSLSSLVEQLHATLLEILKQQDDRLARLEAKPECTTGTAVDELEQTQAYGLHKTVEDSPSKEQPLETTDYSSNDYAMVISVWPDPGQAVLTNTSTATSWYATTTTQYMDLSPLPFITPHQGGLLVHFPEWRSWFQSKFWIPADRRLPLAFDVDHLNQCATVNQAVSKYKALHDFNERLCGYNGRLLIIDNNTFGENRICGNLVEKRGWRRGFLSDRYSMHCDNDGKRLSRVIDEHGLKEIPPMTWTTIDGTIAGTRPVAPWRRLIIIEGLVGVRPKDYFDHSYDYNLHCLWADPESLMPGYGLTIKKFLKASTQSFSSSEGYSFQYSWFFSISHEQIKRWSPENPKIHEASELITDPEWADVSWIRLLKIGKLYGSSKSMIARDAYYFKMIDVDSNDDDSGHRMNNYWSAVVFRRPSWKSNTNMLPIFHAQLQILSHSNEALSCILDDSTEIIDHIGSLLDIGDEVLLDPDRHDQLLFDDEAFSRSRTYWWTLNMLTAMQQSLAETLAVRQEIWDTVLEPLMPMDDWPLGAPEVIRKDKTIVRELTKLQDRIKQQHQRAEALRSGLFNASGVVESRASTRLGEIVKLLTYVSIFYLPLSFSTSLWSTTDQIRSLDTPILFGVMIALGVLTYTVVFNLNNLTRAVYCQYELAKKPWIKKMWEEEGGVWNDRAERYNGFKIKRYDTSPSEWLVIWYIIVWPVRRCLAFRSKRAREDQNTGQQQTNGHGNEKSSDGSHDGGWLKNHPPFPPSENIPPSLQRCESPSDTQPKNPQFATPSKLRSLFHAPRFGQQNSSPSTQLEMHQDPKTKV